MVWMLIIKRYPLPNLGSTEANYGILIGVIVWAAVEDFDAEEPLFESVLLPFQSLFDHKTKQIWIAPAGEKMLAGDDLFQLVANLLLLRIRARSPLAFG